MQRASQNQRNDMMNNQRKTFEVNTFSHDYNPITNSKDSLVLAEGHLGQGGAYFNKSTFEIDKQHIYKENTMSRDSLSYQQQHSNEQQQMTPSELIKRLPNDPSNDYLFGGSRQQITKNSSTQLIKDQTATVQTDNSKSGNNIIIVENEFSN